MSGDPQAAIFLPMAALIALTFLVLFCLGILRMSGMVTGRLPTEHYRYFRSQDDPEPDYLRGFTRNFINLLEVPVLVYSGCIVAYVTGQVDDLLVRLAWLFVAGRAVHSAIHLTYNHFWHRAAAFFVSSSFALAFWAVLTWRLV